MYLPAPFKTPLLCLSLLLLAACGANPEITETALATQPNAPQHQDKPYVIMISIDGYRWDYPELHGGSHLRQMGEEGIRAKRLLSSYPTKTFPNHYSLVTGLSPSRHGLISNEFYSKQRAERYATRERGKVQDGSWYGGVPLWSLAEQSGMRSASFFWVGSEAKVAGYYPSRYLLYDGSIANTDRVDQVVRWLQEPKASRPHLIMLYFSLVDDAGHSYGPEAEKTGEAVREVDGLIKQLDEQVAALGLPVNYVIVSDHGMTMVDQDRLIDVRPYIAGGLTVSKSLPVMLYGDKEPIEQSYQALSTVAGEQFYVYRKAEVPDSLFSFKHEHIGDLVLVPKMHQAFDFGFGHGAAATHGYYPGEPEMGALFIARGPQVKSQLAQLAPFSNVHIYPFVSSMLGLSYSHEIEGADSVLQPYVVRP